jgi:hypothetical protein
MIKLSKRFFMPFTVGGFALLSQYGLAGVADVVNSEGQSMKFEYQGDKLRINTDQGESSYMVLRDGHIYVVTNSDGQQMVIDANQAMGMFGSMAGAAAPSSVASKVVSLKATGKKEELAGIIGEVYELRYISEDGKEHQGELVLSKDARAREFSNALSGMARSLSQVAGKNFEGANDDMQGRLDALNMGVLRYGDDMRISAISDRDVAEARFELPVEPTDMSSIGSLINQSRQSATSGQADSGQSQGSGGVVSSFLGALSGGAAKKDDSPEAEEQGEDGEASKNPLSKAFGKLFDD